MILIAHRGNVVGPSEKENSPLHILNALALGFNAEIDVWRVDNKFMLGHDKPQYEIEEQFLLNDKLWIHAKNIEALHIINEIKPNYLINCFFHNVDACVLTSRGWIWTYPGQDIFSEQAIAVMPERCPQWDISKAGGICSDFIFKY